MMDSTIINVFLHPDLYLTGCAGTYVAASMLEATRPTSYYAKAS